MRHFSELKFLPKFSTSATISPPSRPVLLPLLHSLNCHTPEALPSATYFPHPTGFHGKNINSLSPLLPMGCPHLTFVSRPVEDSTKKEHICTVFPASDSHPPLKWLLSSAESCPPKTSAESPTASSVPGKHSAVEPSSQQGTAERTEVAHKANDFKT